MAKRKFVNTEEKISAGWAQGRGAGHGTDYLPWIDVHGISSKGLSVRFLGSTTGRRHELLSKGEFAVCLDLDWAETVVDIREQFPLCREATILIAHECGIKHPEADGVAVVMTTDFLVDLVGAEGKRRNCAISVKRSSDLEDPKRGPRTIAKLEIERRYWVRREVPWFIVTEVEGSVQRTKTLTFINEMLSLDHLDVPRPSYWRERCDAVTEGIARARGGTILDLARRLEMGEGWRPGEAITAIRHLAANRRLLLDVEQAFDARGPISNLVLATRPALASTRA